MIGRHARRSTVAAVTLVMLGMVGCGQTTRFYVLSPVYGVDKPGGSAGAVQGPTIGLRRVALPDYLDRPQIVTRNGANALQLAEFDRWASPLGEDFTRVLSENLVALVPADRVVPFPWGREARIRYEVAVEVSRFEGRLGGDCALVARWDVFRGGEKAPASSGKVTASEPAGPSYETLVAAKSRLVAGLSRDIAGAIRALPR